MKENEEIEEFTNFLERFELSEEEQVLLSSEGGQGSGSSGNVNERCSASAPGTNYLCF